MTRSRASAKSAGTRHESCQGCGADLPPYRGIGQPRKWCSDDCRNKTYSRAKRSERQRPSIADRFWAKTRRTGECIVWTGSLNEHGYGTFRLPGGVQLAHRVAYWLINGEMPGELHVLHTCDNPSCVNPAHLWLGSHLDNMRDRDMKGRTLQGMAVGIAKFSPETVALVREMAACGIATKQIREQTGVSLCQISYIVNFKSRRIA